MGGAVVAKLAVSAASLAAGAELLRRVRVERNIPRPDNAPEVRFSDVAGCDEVVEQVRECVEFLCSPTYFTSVGARRPNGLLLVGSPGTGKTLLARAMAGEAGAPLYAVSGSDFVNILPGSGAARVRSLFATACRTGGVIFFDELDAVGRARSLMDASEESVRESEAVLNQLLVELDEFPHDQHVLVMAATSRPEILDPALVRPGRFDRVVPVPLPDVDGRAAILAVHARGKNFEGSADFWAIARRSAGMTGADLEQILNEAAILAARRGRAEISTADMEEALVNTALGRERRGSLSQRDREVLAAHEAGRAVAMLSVPDAQPPVRVSIVPRGDRHNSTWAEPSSSTLVSKRAAQARLVVLMAGRAAEAEFYRGDFTNASASDYAEATALVTNMVAEWGMGTTPMQLDRSAAFGQEQIALQGQMLLSDALDTASALMTDRKEAVEAIGAALLSRGTITGEEAAKLCPRQ